MGQKPDELEHQIKELRQESDIIVDELLQRSNLSHVAYGASHAAGSAVRDAVSSASATAETVAGRTQTLVRDTVEKMPEPIRSRPYIVGGALTGLLMSLTSYAVTLAMISRRRTPEDQVAERLKSTVERVGGEADRLGTRLIDAVVRMREQAEEARRTREEARKENPGMLKRVMWVAIISGMATLGSMLFKRLTAEGWRKTMREEPPS